METLTPQQNDRKLKLLYWIAAGAMLIAVAFEAVKQPPNWLSIGARGSLVAALVLLATAKPAETRGKKLVIYALIAISIALLVARLAGGRA